VSWNFQQLKYGWYALAGVVVTGATIYVLNNQRHQVETVDIIELVLGVQERCLATQITTNPTYSVNPITYISHYKDTNYLFAGSPDYDPSRGISFKVFQICYTTFWPNATERVVSYTNTGIDANYNPHDTSLYYAVSYAPSYTNGNYEWVTRRFDTFPFFWVSSTQLMTNVIGFFNDRRLLVELDTKIKALVPYYCDTNTVYDGTTNIVMLTVTGLWASLGIGDKTNQFTRTPCWTNPVSTNWIVNYTSYWPSTSGVTTNINYTSDYRQVVNYAQSWTATGGYVWVSASNWSSVAVTITNQATYGDYPWQIYAEDLQERYKVLNALKMTRTRNGIYTRGKSAFRWNPDWSDWNALKSEMEDEFYNSDEFFSAGTYSLEAYSNGSTNASNPYVTIGSVYYPANALDNSFNSTSVSFSAFLFIFPYEIEGLTFDDNGLGLIENQWKKIDAFPFGLGYNGLPVWCDFPTGAGAGKGFYSLQYQIFNWNFLYCINKYW
jgi:hypothetical protein